MHTNDRVRLPLRVLGIATRPRSRAPMTFHERIVADRVIGLEGDLRGKGGKDRARQVTLLSDRRWRETCAELGAEIPWHGRRANLLVSDLPDIARSIGSCILIGEDVLLEITGITAPCVRMDELHPGLKAALAVGDRGGATCRVLEGGIIAVGDGVVTAPSPP